jgi:hypothetical protein
MSPSVEIWLVVMFMIAGEHPRTLEDSKQSSLEECIKRATKILERALDVRPGDGWEISASCNIRKPVEEES